jgi:hypothetical protein
VGRSFSELLNAGEMATVAETETALPTDASWESSGGSGDDEMKPEFPDLESSAQDGGGLAIAEPSGGSGGGGGGGGGGGAGPEEFAVAEAAQSLSHDEQPPDSSDAGAASLPNGPEEPERPVRRSFQIPRKSREKKGGASPSPQPFFLSPLHLFIRISLPLPTPTRDT